MPAQNHSPYPGLRPFREDEDVLFFGREEQTAELVTLLREHRFLAVVGRSGSGKSSLVRAGLLPEIQGGMMQHAGSAWEIAIARPGGHPLRNLASSLVEAGLYDEEDEESIPRILATLNHSSLGLVEAFRQSDITSDTNLLVLIDQFEELFRFETHDLRAKEEAHGFVELLLEASRNRDVPIYIVLTMRSDYLGDCAHVPGLAEAVNSGEYLIPRLTREQLRSAIEGPSSVGGAAMSYRLVQHLLNEVGEQEDQLPVLQHALMRTWDIWAKQHGEGEPLDLHHYESTGGMQLAISNHADEIFEGLPDEVHRDLAERVYRALTVKADDHRGVRRPTRLDQLVQITGQPPDDVRLIIEAFRRPGVTFLMPGQETPLAEDTVVDISHESLMRVWQRLRMWVDDEAQSARIYRRLVDTAALRRERKAGLYRDPDLQIALTWREQENPNSAWAEQYGGQFEHSIEFLEQSQAAAEADEHVREEARQKELQQAKVLAEVERQRADQQRRAALHFRRFSLVGVTLAIAAILLAVWALQLRKVAVDKEQIALEAKQVALDAKQSAVDAKQSAVDAEGQAKEAFQDSQHERGNVWLERARTSIAEKDFLARN